VAELWEGDARTPSTGRYPAAYPLRHKELREEQPTDPTAWSGKVPADG